MGCDGGSIPKRIELVKTKQKEALPDKQVIQDTKWFHCTLSKELLRSPIVADFLGNLYNKEAVIRYLLNKAEFGDADQVCSHIRSLKDVVTLNTTPNPALLVPGSTPSSTSSTASPSESVSDGVRISQFICPVTMKEMNGSIRFSFLATCGCVYSEKALAELPDNEPCTLCNKLYSREDAIPLNGSPEQLELLRAKLEERKSKTKDSKKKKVQVDSSTVAVASDGSHSQSHQSLKRKQEMAGISSSATLPRAKIRRAVDEAEETIKAKVTASSAYSSLFTDKAKKDVAPSKAKSQAEAFFNRGSIRYIM